MSPLHHHEEGTALLEKLEEALYALAHCMNLNLLDSDTRARLLNAMDTLSLVWSRLLAEPLLSREETRRLRALTELCEVARTASEREAVVLSVVIERIATVPAIEPQARGEAVMSAEPAAPSVEVSPAEAVSEQPPEADPSLSEGAPADQSVEEVASDEPEARLAEQTASAGEQIEAEHEAPAEPLLPDAQTPSAEPYADLSRVLDEVSEAIDRVANHTMPTEQATVLLLFAASRVRWLRPRSAFWEKEWELQQVKSDLERLAKKRRVWLPPLDPKFEFSDYELEVLAEGYRALERSWDMWEWYQQNGAGLEKNTAAPLLESIAAPIAMVQQIYQQKDILPQASDADGTASLRELITSEASRRKWKLEMLSLNCSRARQVHHLQHANERWEAARAKAQKEKGMETALDALEMALQCPNPETFEEDLLCALVQCHRAGVPTSNRRLRQIMSGYQWLLENPAVPDRCGLSPAESKTARKYLVDVGKYLISDMLKGKTEEQEPEPQPEAEQNHELLEQARAITQGKKLFLLCFNRRAEAEQRIRDELGLAEVDWPDLDGGESVNNLEARIRKADITVVVVRYSRTHWKEAVDIARQNGKMAVMATKGYGVTHLAQQIVNQCPNSAGG